MEAYLKLCFEYQLKKRVKSCWLAWKEVLSG